ncbi:MAG: hypothetical protein HYY84_12355 [Deltaproteobacteria bacterium]|nr:hypothetical protein [Deltaproteobacteria bacterium]
MIHNFASGVRESQWLERASEMGSACLQSANPTIDCRAMFSGIRVRVVEAAGRLVARVYDVARSFLPWALRERIEGLLGWMDSAAETEVQKSSSDYRGGWVTGDRMRDGGSAASFVGEKEKASIVDAEQHGAEERGEAEPIVAREGVGLVESPVGGGDAARTLTERGVAGRVGSAGRHARKKIRRRRGGGARE